MNKPEIKNWVLTPHAAQRLQERNVSVEEVRVVLEKPDIVKSHGQSLFLQNLLKTEKTI